MSLEGEPCYQAVNVLEAPLATVPHIEPACENWKHFLVELVLVRALIREEVKPTHVANVVAITVMAITIFPCWQSNEF